MPGFQKLIVCEGTATSPCDFKALLLLINVVIHDLIWLSTIIATLVFVYVGFRLLTSGGNTSAMEAAKKSAMAVLKGYAAILVAWVLIYTITHALLNTGYSLLE